MATAPPAGLCSNCVHQRVVRSDRGSLFSLCERSHGDPGFVKYPPLPVLSCRGYEPREAMADDLDV